MLIGVDFGGTQVKAGIVENGEVVRSTSTPTRAGSGADDVLDTIASTVLALSSIPDAVGVADSRCEVNSEGRCWRLPNVPGFEGVHIAEELAKRLRCPIAVEHDATTAALGERLYGHGRAHPSFLMLTLGTGIGGGIGAPGTSSTPAPTGFAAEIRAHEGRHRAGGAAVRVRATRLRRDVRRDASSAAA